MARFGVKRTKEHSYMAKYESALITRDILVLFYKAYLIILELQQNQKLKTKIENFFINNITTKINIKKNLVIAR